MIHNSIIKLVDPYTLTELFGCSGMTHS